MRGEKSGEKNETEEEKEKKGRKEKQAYHDQQSTSQLSIARMQGRAALFTYVCSLVIIYDRFKSISLCI